MAIIFNTLLRRMVAPYAVSDLLNDTVYKYMTAPRETPAGYSRTLHQKVKEFRAGMEAEGVSREASYMVLMSVVMRLAYEEHGEAGMANLIKMLEGGV